ncbi:uncharacterized protein [Haliotis cracherodii]|uniref:uncharacterized protein n=1 Tax=Haliotis cracherodii TaxID=6455 RepID=UPI0039EB6A85
MIARAIVVLAVVVSVYSVPQLRRIKRKSGDSPPSGECMTFNLGGKSRLHSYVCCNNLSEEDSTCDGETYQRASILSYCKSGGFDGGDGHKKGSTYPCMGCTGQRKIAAKCKPHIWLNFIGTCWLFPMCFEKHCRRQYQIIGVMPDTCYNGVCDAGETTDNCPVDCCYKKNSKCTWSTLRCLPEYCNTPTCTGGGRSVMKETGTNGLSVMIISLAMLMF